MSEALAHSSEIKGQVRELGRLEQNLAYGESALADRKDSRMFRMVTFSLGRKAYGIDIMRVKEISSARRFTYVPNTIPYVRGVFNLRGEITPVIDMRLFFNLEITGERSELDITRNNEIYEDLIILTFDYINIAIIVDSISHVVGVRSEMIQRSHPLFSELDVPYIEGIVECSDQLYIILAMDRILDPYLDSGEQANFDLGAVFRDMNKGLSRALQTKPRAERPFAEKPFVDTSLSGLSLNPAKTPSLEPLAAELQAIDAGEGDRSNKEHRADGFSEAIQQASTELQTNGEQKARTESIEANRRDSSSFEAEVSCKAPVSGDNSLALALETEGLILTPLNEKKIQQKYFEWYNSKNFETAIPMEVLLESVHNRKELLALLQSKDHNSYWSAELAEALKPYFFKRSGNLNVWHANCGNGQESYSITAALLSAAPEANIQVRAADSNLLEVAKAPMQSVGTPSELHEWLAPYLNKERGTEGYTFTGALKDCIIFEYQDVIHSTPHTKPDLIVIRDLLSQHPQSEQDYVLNTIEHSLKKNGLLVIGDNEELDEEKWELLQNEPLKIYRARDLQDLQDSQVS